MHSSRLSSSAKNAFRGLASPGSGGARMCYIRPFGTYPVLRDNIEIDQKAGYTTKTVPLTSPLNIYKSRLEAGLLKQDLNQLLILEKLEDINKKINVYLRQEPQRKTGLLSSFFKSKNKNKSKKEDIPMGLYIYGSVGTGKTTIMDIFYNALDTVYKKRVHFHEFMVGVHRRVQEIKEKKVEQPIRFVAKEISEEAKVLCFDEFQVTDIADAMILRQLTTELFEQGVVLISTSNRGPDELYKNGLQRASFIPCIQMIKEHCQVVNLDSGIDYRKHAKPVVSSLYLSPNDQNNSLKLMEIFYALCGDDKISTGRGIKFLGREFIIPKSTENVALIDFGTLCKEHHGAVDYLEIFKSIKVLVLHDVPQMGSLNRDEARRFITLVDTLYEKNVLLVMSSQVDVYQIFRVAKHEGESSAGDVSVLYTGEEELFAFERTLSRLVEMNGADYLKKVISRYPPARFLLN